MPTMSRLARTAALLAAAVALAGVSACSTSPSASDETTFVYQSNATRTWFENHVPGLDQQIANSAGYVAFPNVGQFGVLIAGSKFGRGTVYDSSGQQVGWAYINTASAGLQLGAQGFKMLMVFQDPATMRRFQENKLTGNASAVAVAAESGRSGSASFTDGVALYQGDNAGLMAGASIGLDYIRYEPLGSR